MSSKPELTDDDMQSEFSYTKSDAGAFSTHDIAAKSASIEDLNVSSASTESNPFNDDNTIPLGAQDTTQHTTAPSPSPQKINPPSNQTHKINTSSNEGQKINTSSNQAPPSGFRGFQPPAPPATSSNTPKKSTISDNVDTPDSSHYYSGDFGPNSKSDSPTNTYFSSHANDRKSYMSGLSAYSGRFNNEVAQQVSIKAVNRHDQPPVVKYTTNPSASSSPVNSATTSPTQKATATLQASQQPSISPSNVPDDHFENDNDDQETLSTMSHESSIKLGKLATQSSRRKPGVGPNSEADNTTNNTMKPTLSYDTNVEASIPPRSTRRPRSEIVMSSNDLQPDIENFKKTRRRSGGAGISSVPASPNTKRHSRRHGKKPSISDDLDRLMESANSITSNDYTFDGNLYQEGSSSSHAGRPPTTDPQKPSDKTIKEEYESTEDDGAKSGQYQFPHSSQQQLTRRNSDISTETFETANMIKSSENVSDATGFVNPSASATAALTQPTPKPALPPRPSLDKVKRAHRLSSQILAEQERLSRHSSRHSSRDSSSSLPPVHSSRGGSISPSPPGEETINESGPFYGGLRKFSSDDHHAFALNRLVPKRQNSTRLASGGVVIDDDDDDDVKLINPVLDGNGKVNKSDSENKSKDVVADADNQTQPEGAAHGAQFATTEPLPESIGGDNSSSEDNTSYRNSNITDVNTIHQQHHPQTGPEGTPDKKQASENGANDEDQYYDIGSPVIVSQPSRGKSVKDSTTRTQRKPRAKRAKSKRVKSRGTGERDSSGGLKPFSYHTLVNLLESINGTVIGEEFNQLNLPVKEKQLIEKIIDSLSRLTSDMVIDESRYEVGLQRLEKALRVLEGFM